MKSLLCLLLVSCTLVHGIYFDTTTCSDTTPCVYVTPTGNDQNSGNSTFPLRTIQKALTILKTATIPTTIVLADGTYDGKIEWSGSNITLTSINGAATTFIDCNQIANQRGLWIGSGETAATVISGVTIRNCRTQMGGGMAIVGEQTKPTIRDVIIANNYAVNGGGVFVFFASPTFINVTISGNSGNNGAGMFVTHNASTIIPQQLQAMSLALNYVPTNPLPQGYTALLQMSYMTFTNNVGVGIGAGYFLQSAYRVSCSHCTFANNIASGSGCIGVGSRSFMTVSDSTFINNQANGLLGGAVSIQQFSRGKITRCNFTNNMATQNGGAIAVGTGATVNITDSVFDGNQALQGSILFNDATSKVTITGCTTRNNIATNQGGIMLLNPSSASQYNITSNTYENNVAQGNYGADYGSVPSALAFIPADSAQLGVSARTPSIPPFNISTSFTRSIHNMDILNVRIILVDSFGQRVDTNSSNQTNLYANIMTLDNITVPALLVQNTHEQFPGGMAEFQVIIVGEVDKTYAITFSCDISNVTPIKIYATIQGCQPLDVVTYYDNTNFPICHVATAQHISDSLFMGIVVISCILMACVVIVQGLTIWYWNTPVFKGSTPLFMSLMLLGAIIGYLATILSVLDVNHTNMFDAVCKSQYWMMGVAFILMFATLALKTWRIRNIFCNETLTEIRTVSTCGLTRWLGLVLAIEMAIHIIWISVDPLHPTLGLSTNALSYTCESKNANVFLIVNLVYKGLIAAVCVLFAYQTRDVVSKFNESRQLMIASYNMFICVVVIAALSLALPSVDARRTVYAVGALFVITSTWFVLFMPKLYLAIFKSEQNVSHTHTGGNGSGGKNSHSQDPHKYSFGKGNNTTFQKSKSSYQEMVNTASPTTPSRSKAGSAANTAPGSPVVQHHKLSLNLGTRPSMSGMVPSPVAGSPQISAIAMNIPRHLTSGRTTDTPVPGATSQDDVILSIPALDLTGLNENGVRRSSQATPPQQQSGEGSSPGSGQYTPASEYSITPAFHPFSPTPPTAFHRLTITPNGTCTNVNTLNMVRGSVG